MAGSMTTQTVSACSAQNRAKRSGSVAHVVEPVVDAGLENPGKKVGAETDPPGADERRGQRRAAGEKCPPRKRSTTASTTKERL